MYIGGYKNIICKMYGSTIFLWMNESNSFFKYIDLSFSPSPVTVTALNIPLFTKSLNFYNPNSKLLPPPPMSKSLLSSNNCPHGTRFNSKVNIFRWMAKRYALSVRHSDAVSCYLWTTWDFRVLAHIYIYIFFGMFVWFVSGQWVSDGFKLGSWILAKD